MKMKTVFPLFAAGLMVLAGCNNKAQEVAPQGQRRLLPVCVRWLDESASAYGGVFAFWYYRHGV